MPYLPKERQTEIFSDLKGIIERGGMTPGDLNFCLTTVSLGFVTQGGRTPRYADYNAAIGALESAKLELYRRMVAPYEDGKIAENGDVYP